VVESRLEFCLRKVEPPYGLLPASTSTTTTNG
jgi:hypothetical protein